MFQKLAYASIVVIIGGLIAWGLVTYINLVDTRSELGQLRGQMGVLEVNLENAEQRLARTQEDLTSTQQQLTLAQQELTSVEQELYSAEWTIDSLESQLELYQDTWGLVASGISEPSADVNLVNRGTNSNPTWAQLLDFLLADRTDERTYVSDVYVCRHFANDVHNHAELSGIRAAYVTVELTSGWHALNAFKTTDRGLVFIDCTGLEASQSGPSNCDKTVSVRIGRSYIPKSLFPEFGWSVTWGSLGTVRDVEIYW